jgi:hypothetical protein
MRLVLNTHGELSISCDRQGYLPDAAATSVNLDLAAIGEVDRRTHRDVLVLLPL